MELFMNPNKRHWLQGCPWNLSRDVKQSIKTQAISEPSGVLQHSNSLHISTHRSNSFQSLLWFNFWLLARWWTELQAQVWPPQMRIQNLSSNNWRRLWQSHQILEQDVCFKASFSSIFSTHFHYKSELHLGQTCMQCSSKGSSFFVSGNMYVFTKGAACKCVTNYLVCTVFWSHNVTLGWYRASNIQHLKMWNHSKSMFSSAGHVSFATWSYEGYIRYRRMLFPHVSFRIPNLTARALHVGPPSSALSVELGKPSLHVLSFLRHCYNTTFFKARNTASNTSRLTAMIFRVYFPKTKYHIRASNSIITAGAARVQVDHCTPTVQIVQASTFSFPTSTFT